MARKITTQAVTAFLNGREWRSGNTSVEIRPFKTDRLSSVILLLHNNPIARRHVGAPSDQFMVCDGGWQTRTTKDRLNGLPGVIVNQAKGEWFLNGKPWDGSWTEVAPSFVVRQRVDGTWVCTDPCHAVHVFPTEAAARAYATIGRGACGKVA